MISEVPDCNLGGLCLCLCLIREDCSSVGVWSVGRGGEGGRRLSCGGRPRRGLFICSLVGEAHPVLECVCVFRMRAWQNMWAMCLVLGRMWWVFYSFLCSQGKFSSTFIYFSVFKGLPLARVRSGTHGVLHASTKTNFRELCVRAANYIGLQYACTRSKGLNPYLWRIKEFCLEGIIPCACVELWILLFHAQDRDFFSLMPVYRH